MMVAKMGHPTSSVLQELMSIGAPKGCAPCGVSRAVLVRPRPDTVGLAVALGGLGCAGLRGGKPYPRRLPSTWMNAANLLIPVRAAVTSVPVIAGARRTLGRTSI